MAVLEDSLLQKHLFLADAKPLNRLLARNDLRAGFRWGFWRMRAPAGRPFPPPLPTVLAIFAQESPCARRAAILAASTTLRGLPSVFPLARAFRSPARTRSTIKLRSSSATAPRTVNIILPVGVVVSICSLRLTNAMPSALNVSKARSR